VGLQAGGLTRLRELVSSSSASAALTAPDGFGAFLGAFKRVG
jgi:hypothetical protein